jgi:SET domain-containing protein
MLDRFELKIARQRLVSAGSPIEGLGVFAKIGFRRGELLCVMQGERIGVPQVKERYRRGILRLSDPLQVSERVYVHLEPLLMCINHSCNPNAAVVGEADLVAVRAIDEGEEIAFDYSPTEWTWERFGRYAEWNMPCSCGESNCRGVVSQFPFMPKSLKKDYFRQGIVPNFIRRKVIDAGLDYDGGRVG